MARTRPPNRNSNPLDDLRKRRDLSQDIDALESHRNFLAEKQLEIEKKLDDLRRRKMVDLASEERLGQLKQQRLVAEQNLSKLRSRQQQEEVEPPKPKTVVIPPIPPPRIPPVPPPRIPPVPPLPIPTPIPPVPPWARAALPSMLPPRPSIPATAAQQANLRGPATAQTGWEFDLKSIQIDVHRIANMGGIGGGGGGGGKLPGKAKGDLSEAALNLALIGGGSGLVGGLAKTAYAVKSVSGALEGAGGMVAGIGGIAAAIPAAIDGLKSLSAKIIELGSFTSPGAGIRWKLAAEDFKAVVGRLVVPHLELMTQGLRLFGDFLHTILPGPRELRDAFAPLQDALKDMKPALQELVPVLKDVMLATARATGLMSGFVIRGMLPLVKLLTPLGLILGGPQADLKSSVGQAPREPKFGDLSGFLREQWASIAHQTTPDTVDTDPARMTAQHTGTMVNTLSRILDAVLASNRLPGIPGSSGVIEGVIEGVRAGARGW